MPVFIFKNLHFVVTETRALHRRQTQSMEIHEKSSLIARIYFNAKLPPRRLSPVQNVPQFYRIKKKKGKLPIAGVGKITCISDVILPLVFLATVP